MKIVSRIVEAKELKPKEVYVFLDENKVWQYLVLTEVWETSLYRRESHGGELQKFEFLGHVIRNPKRVFANDEWLEDYKTLKRIDGSTDPYWKERWQNQILLTGSHK